MSQWAQPTLVGIPQEMRDLILSHLAQGDSWLRDASALRRSHPIFRKDEELRENWAIAAFSHLGVSVSLRGMVRLAHISNSEYAKLVVSIMLTSRNTVGNETVTYQRVVDELAAALPRFPRLQEVRVRCDQPFSTLSREHRLGSYLSPNDAFSVIRDGLRRTDVRPSRLTFVTLEDRKEDGISTDYLIDLEDAESPAAFSQLQELELWMAPEHDDPMEGNTAPADFLGNCQRLNELRLGCRIDVDAIGSSDLDVVDDWEKTQEACDEILRWVHLPNLRRLELTSMRCTGEHLMTFLGRHDMVESLSMSNLDIMGDRGLYEILQLLRGSSNLRHFECKQIAREQWRLFFDEHSVPGNRYHGRAEEQEGMSEKLETLKKDLRMSAEGDYDPEAEDSDSDQGLYEWGTGSEEVEARAGADGRLPNSDLYPDAI